ncbi:Ig-like domain-containing protein [Mumia flava]|uniref:Ig-like domain-containing protein n=1 Tax=Mumia flava TaxID=1348852 RepID=A0A0B2B1A6_9ACTN|nr:M14 family metallopeptidase [Mumia flava]PJJ54342.1 Ig-like domain-containing protein [Mumia flava]
MRTTKRGTARWLAALVGVVALTAPGLVAGTSVATAEEASLPSGNTDFRTWDDYVAEMDRLAAEHPDLVEKFVMPEKTTQGREVYGLVISSDVATADDKPAFVDVGLHHGNEWASAELTMEYAIEVVENADSPTYASLLDDARLVVVPVVNVDGLIADTRQVATGVDMNRNYGFGWANRSRPGTGPWSEPETRNMRWLLSTSQGTVFNTQHTCIKVVLYPPLLKAAGPAQDTPRLHALAADVAASYGPDYSALASADDYETNGEAIDYAYYATRGLSITTETCPDVRPRGHEFGPEVLDVYDNHAEAMTKAFTTAADPAEHATITGVAPKGSKLTLTKDFTMWTSPYEQADGTVAPTSFEEHLESSMTVTADDGTFSWGVNSSYRPVPAYTENGVEGPQTEYLTEPYTLTCESPTGRTASTTVNVDVGESVEAALDACREPTTVKATALPAVFGLDTVVLAHVQGKPKPDGEIVVEVDGREIGDGTLFKGRAAVRIDASTLSRGRHELTVTYAGSPTSAPSSTTTKLLVLRK